MNICDLIHYTVIIFFFIALSISQIFHLKNPQIEKMGNSESTDIKQSDSPEQWKIDNQDEIDNIWEYKKYCGGVFRNAMICSFCKNANTYTCNCAKARWMKDLTYNEFLGLKLSNIQKERLKLHLDQINEEKTWLANCK